MSTVIGIVLIVLGYVCGSLASAIIVCRAMNLPDPRQGGSGNPGATNVLRIGGKKPAALTLVGDVLKGLIPVLLAHLLSDSPAVISGTALAAFLGHLFPVFFQFQGGKGVATAFGAIAGLVFPVALFMVAVWVLVAMTTRYASLASMCAAAASPLFALIFIREPAYIVTLLVIAALLIFRHRANIGRLRAGTESQIGDSFF